jgi:hypothetical protein
MAAAREATLGACGSGSPAPGVRRSSRHCSAPAFLTTILLALQVQAAVRSHRNATQSMLHDDAMLAADEFIRRSAVEVGYEGIYQPLLHLDQTPPPGGSGLVGPLIVGASNRVTGVLRADPDHLRNGSASARIEIPLSSFKTGIGMRDRHVATALA